MRHAFTACHQLQYDYEPLLRDGFEIVGIYKAYVYPGYPGLMSMKPIQNETSHQLHNSRCEQKASRKNTGRNQLLCISG
jgi:hypothetical protein